LPLVQRMRSPAGAFFASAIEIHLCSLSLPPRLATCRRTASGTVHQSPQKV
jgi:hypothetical protein